MARLPHLNADQNQWGAVLNEFLRVAHNDNGTLKLDEVDAVALGVVPNDASAATTNSQVINHFFTALPAQGGGWKLLLPAGEIYIDQAINMINVVNVKNSLSLRGHGIGTTILRKTADGPMIQLAGFFNSVSDLTVSGFSAGISPVKAARCGIYLLGYPQPGITVPSRLNTVRNVRVTGCQVGIRVGHYNTLDDDRGDGVSPDITANIWQNIFLEANRYGLVRDGQNILNDHFENLYCVNIDRYHVYLPFGGDFRCFTAQFGSTLESASYPKICSAGAGSVILVNARSENGGVYQPIFLQTIHAQTFVELHEVVVTNNTGTANLDVDFRGGRATVVNSHVSGTVRLSNTQYIGLNNQVGAYDKPNVSQNNTIILDAAIGTAGGSQNSDVSLEVTELMIKRTGPTGQNGARLHFSSSAMIDSGDGAFYFFPPDGITQTFMRILSRKFGDSSAQSAVTLKNAGGNAVIATDGLNGGSPGAFQVQSNGVTVFTVDRAGNMQASGTKSAVVSAGKYGDCKLYALESPQNWFEDFGSGILRDCVATINIDPVFAQTVNLEMPYHVFLTPLGKGALYIEQKTPASFTVRATEDGPHELAFDYRIVALRKGFEDVRLACASRDMLGTCR